jgi:hypothetical protein
MVDSEINSWRFLVMPRMAGGGGQLDPFVSRPVLFADPVFGFQVA